MEVLVDDVIHIIHDYVRMDNFYGISAISFRLATMRFIVILKPHRIGSSFDIICNIKRNIYKSIYFNHISDNFARASNSVIGKRLTNFDIIGMTALEYAVDDLAYNNGYMIKRICEIFGYRFAITKYQFICLCKLCARHKLSKSKFKRYMRETFMYVASGESRVDMCDVLKCEPRFKHELMSLWNEYENSNRNI
jgi:hypothetical protein